MNEFEPLLKEDKDELTFEKKEEVQNEPIIKEEKVIQESDTQDEFSFEKLLEQVVEEQPLIKNETTEEEHTPEVEPEIKVTTEEVKEEPKVAEEKEVVVEEPKAEEIKVEESSIPEMPKEAPTEQPVPDDESESSDAQAPATPTAQAVQPEEVKEPEVKAEETPVPEMPKEDPGEQSTPAEVAAQQDAQVVQTEEAKEPEVKVEEPKVAETPVPEIPKEAPTEQPVPTEEPKAPETPSTNSVPPVDNSGEGQQPVEPPKEGNKKLPPDKKKTALIVTIVLAVLALYLLGRTAYGFYIGFKYYGYDSKENKETKNNNDSEINNVEEVSLESLMLQNTFNKFKVGICSSNYTMIDNLYTTERVGINKFTIDEIGTILFSNVSNIPSCGSGKVSISKDALSSLMLELFGTEAYMGELSTFPTHVYGNLSVDYDSLTSSFKVGYANCELCANTSDFIIANIERATSGNDYLYVYERFGYFKNTGDNTFNVFSDGLLTNPKTTFVKTDDNSSFSDLNTLTLYKWTFKKIDDNNYHFVSIEPTN